MNKNRSDRSPDLQRTPGQTEQTEVSRFCSMAWKTVFTNWPLCQGRTTDAAKSRDEKKRQEKGVQKNDNDIYPPEGIQIKLFFLVSHRISVPMSFSPASHSVNASITSKKHLFQVHVVAVE